MIWPWMTLYKGQGQDIEQFPHVRAWLDRCKARPAFSKGRAAGADLSKTGIADNSKEAEEARKILFGQKARI
jgi:glutathione S-transferase/GST-like protein